MKKFFDKKKKIMRIDYHKYHFSKEELIFYTTIFLGEIIAVAYVFYRSYIAAIVLSPVIYLLMKRQQKKLCMKQKGELEGQFKEAIMSVSANLKAGYSIENAFFEAYQDVAMLYGKNSLMGKEMGRIINGINNNMILEELLLDFAKRSDLEDVADFAEIFRVAKRSGGDLNGIIRETVGVISEKISVRREIETMIRAKEYEQKIMSLIPFGIIIYVSITSPGYFDSLYHNALGNIVMTVCLLVYLIAIIWSEKIMKINV